eukprot:8340426-Pyramimonas_sp.AAC.1
MNDGRRRGECEEGEVMRKSRSRSGLLRTASVSLRALQQRHDIITTRNNTRPKLSIPCIPT